MLHGCTLTLCQHYLLLAAVHPIYHRHSRCTQNYANSTTKNQLESSHLVDRRLLLQVNKLNKLQSLGQVRTGPDKTSLKSPSATVWVTHSLWPSNSNSTDAFAFCSPVPFSSITLALLLSKSFNANKVTFRGEKDSRGEFLSCCFDHWPVYPDPSPILWSEGSSFKIGRPKNFRSWFKLFSFSFVSSETDCSIRPCPRGRTFPI